MAGNLAPFNEEMTFNFRGPMNLFNIAVYQPNGSGAAWTQTSSWAAGQAPNNLVFMNNMGGGASGMGFRGGEVRTGCRCRGGAGIARLRKVLWMTANALRSTVDFKVPRALFGSTP